MSAGRTFATIMLHSQLSLILTFIYMQQDHVVKKLICSLFVLCLTTHQPLWVKSVRRYYTKHDVDEKSKNL